MISTPPANAEGVFDILDETIYTGNWSDANDAYNLPPEDGAWNQGHIWKITNVRRIGTKHKIYAQGYSRCNARGRSTEMGVTLCSGDGCWVPAIRGGHVFIVEGIYNAQSNATKLLIDRLCGGVVPRDWTAFEGHPDKPYDVEIQNDGRIWGYVDVRFANLSKIDDTYYIPSDDDFKIKSGSWDSIGSHKWKRYGGEWEQHRWSITDSTTCNVSGDKVDAKINVTLRWAYRIAHEDGTYNYDNHTSVTTFSTSVVSPRVLSSPPNASVTIVSHNNSVTPYSLIGVHIDENTTSTEINYKNHSSIYHNRVGLLTHEDDLEYFAFIDEPVWKPAKNNMVAMRAGYYVINEAPLNLSALNIIVSNPYQSQEVTDYNVTVINSKPSDYVHSKVMFAFLSLLGVFIIIPYRLLRGMRL